MRTICLSLGLTLALASLGIRAEETAAVRADLLGSLARPPTVHDAAAAAREPLRARILAGLSPAGLCEAQSVNAEMLAAATPLSSAWISASTDNAIDSGESAPIASPTGPLSLARNDLADSPSSSSRRSRRALGPSTPR